MFANHRTVLRGGYGANRTAGTLRGSFPAKFPREAEGCGHESDSDFEDYDDKRPEEVSTVPYAS